MWEWCTSYIVRKSMDVVSYVDLNPVRTKMAGTSETSGHARDIL